MKPRYDKDIDELKGSNNMSSFKIGLAALKNLRANFNNKNRTCYLEFTPIAPIYDSEGNNIAVDTGLNKGWTMTVSHYEYNTSIGGFKFINNTHIPIIPYTFSQIDFVSIFTSLGGNINRGYEVGRAPYLQISVANTPNTNYKLHNLRLYADDGAIVSMSNIISNLPSDLQTGLSGLDSEMLNRTVPVGDLKTLYTDCNNSDRYSVIDSDGNRIWQNNREIRYADCKFPTTKPAYIAMEGLDASKGDSYNINNGEYSYSKGLNTQLEIFSAQSKVDLTCVSATSETSDTSTTSTDTTNSTDTTTSSGTYAIVPPVCSFKVFDKLWISAPHNDHEWSTSDKTIQSKYNPHRFRIINNETIPVQISIQKSVAASETATVPVINIYRMTYDPSSTTKVKKGTKVKTINYLSKSVYNNYSKVAGQSFSVYTFTFVFPINADTYIEIVGGEDQVGKTSTPETTGNDKSLTWIQFIKGKKFTVAPGDASKGLLERKVAFVDEYSYVGDDFYMGKSENIYIDNPDRIRELCYPVYYKEWESDKNDEFIDPVYGKSIYYGSESKDERFYVKTIKSIPSNNICTKDDIEDTPLDTGRLLSEMEWKYLLNRTDDKGLLMIHLRVDGDYQIDEKLKDKIESQLDDTSYGLGEISGIAAGVSVALSLICAGYIYDSWGGSVIVTFANGNQILLEGAGFYFASFGICLIVAIIISIAVVGVVAAQGRNEQPYITYLLPDDYEEQLSRLKEIIKSSNKNLTDSDVSYIDNLRAEECRPKIIDHGNGTTTTKLFNKIEYAPILEAIGAKAIWPLGYYEAGSQWKWYHRYVSCGVAGYGQSLSKVRSAYVEFPDIADSLSNIKKYPVQGTVEVVKVGNIGRNRKYPMLPVVDYASLGAADGSIPTEIYSGLRILYNTHHIDGKNSSDMRISTKWCGYSEIYDPTKYPYNGSYHANLLDNRYKNSRGETSTGFLLVDYTYNYVLNNMFEDSNVTWIEFPKNLYSLTIDKEAFKDCSYISYIILHPTTTKISFNDNIFSGYTLSPTIYFQGTKDWWNANVKRSSSWTGGKTVTVVCSDGSRITYN